MKRNDMPCSPGCRSECFIHAEHSGLHLTPNSPRTITHQPKTDTSKTNQRPTERRLQQTLDRNWLCDQWLSLMELSTTWRNSCDTTNILKDWLTSLDLNFTTTISNQNLKFREERYIEDHLSLNTFIARTMCQVLVQVLSNLNSFTMEFCEMGVLCTISEMKKRWVLIRACLRSQAVKGWRGSQDHAHHTVPRTVHMHSRCWLRWVSRYFMSEAPGELPPQPETQKLRISRRQDWGSAHYFQYFQFRIHTSN